MDMTASVATSRHMLHSKAAPRSSLFLSSSSSLSSKGLFLLEDVLWSSDDEVLGVAPVLLDTSASPRGGAEGMASGLVPFLSCSLLLSSKGSWSGSKAAAMTQQDTLFQPQKKRDVFPQIAPLMKLNLGDVSREFFPAVAG